MKRYWIILLGAGLLGFFAIPGNAAAHTSHMGVHAKSPFDAPKVKKSLHCLLLKHHHAALPVCPHTQHGRSMETQFKADCGDSPSGAPVQIQWSKMLMLFPTGGEAASTETRNFSAPKQFRLLSPFANLLEKPPQHA